MGGVGDFFNKPGNQFRKKNAKKETTRKYFHPMFFFAL